MSAKIVSLNAQPRRIVRNVAIRDDLAPHPDFCGCLVAHFKAVMLGKNERQQLGALESLAAYMCEYNIITHEENASIKHLFRQHRCKTLRENEGGV